MTDEDNNAIQKNLYQVQAIINKLPLQPWTSGLRTEPRLQEGSATPHGARASGSGSLTLQPQRSGYDQGT